VSRVIAIVRNQRKDEGALTPTELITVFEHGLREIKIFPAGSLGPSFIRDLLGPFPDLRAIPTGVTRENARAFLEAGAVAVGVGGALTGHVPQGSYEMVTERSADLRAHGRQVRRPLGHRSANQSFASSLS
jgi:2-keto-3-deoxy-6-phosphogluconate aldolase